MPLSRWMEQYQRGDYAGVIADAEKLTAATATSAVALRLAGQAAAKLAQPLLAATYFLRAAQCSDVSSASHGESLANAGLMLARAGRPDAATLAWLSDLRLSTHRSAHSVSVRQLFEHFSDRVDAQLACLATAVHSPAHFHPFFPVFLQQLDSCDVDAPKRPVPRPAMTGPISVIVCSHREDRFARFSAECAHAFAGDDVEIVRIDDARFMGDGYRRGMASARGEWLLFTHDDIELLSPEFARRVRESFAGADVFFPVGSAALAGPAWFSAGPAYLRGAVTLPSAAPGACDVAWCGVVRPDESMALGDGFFIGAHRGVAHAIGWDGDPDDGFHGYDLSFTCRAARSGVRVRAATRLQILHYSLGDFDANWLSTAGRVCVRHAIPGGPARSAQWVRRNGIPRQDAVALFDRVADWLDAAPAALEGLIQDALGGCVQEAASVGPTGDSVNRVVELLRAVVSQPAALRG
ncbi:MAG: hypothetical protein JNL19_00590 [Burkholderiales bacterium]|nr:hypothetical protein [Burkholderiales bacterium]